MTLYRICASCFWLQTVNLAGAECFTVSDVFLRIKCVFECQTGLVLGFIYLFIF